MGRQGLARLHGRASRWYEQHGSANEAITHALAASDFERAADLIERHAGDTTYHSETIKLLRWLRALPEEVIRARPLLCLRYAWVLLDTLSGTALEATERWLQEAEKALSDGLTSLPAPVSGASPPDGLASLAAPVSGASPPDGLQGTDRTRGHLYDQVARESAVIRAYLVNRCRGDPQAALALSLQVLERVPEDDLVRRATILFNLGWAHLRLGDATTARRVLEEGQHAARASGQHYFATLATETLAYIARRQGRLREAAAICREGLSSIVEPVEKAGRPIPAAGWLHMRLAGVLLEWNDLEGADRLLAQALERTKLLVGLGAWAIGYGELDRLRRVQGNMTEALRVIEQIERFWPEAESYSYAAALRVRLWLAHAERDPSLLARAARWAQEIWPQFDDSKDVLAVADEWYFTRCLALVRLRIAQHRAHGRPDLQPGLDFLERQLRVHEEGGWNECVIELLILKALALDAQGETGRALEALRRALALAEPEGYVRIFLDEGPPMARLLYQAVERGIAPAYAGRLLAAFPAAEPRQADLSKAWDVEGEMVEPLSEREHEVLELIAEGLSNREVAQRLFISPRTVKRHTSNIYGKLGVHSRTQAVARARLVGILPHDRA